MISSFVLLLALSMAFGFAVQYFFNARWGTAVVLISLLVGAGAIGFFSVDWTLVKGGIFVVLFYVASLVGGYARQTADARSAASKARAEREAAVFDAHHS